MENGRIKGKKKNIYCSNCGNEGHLFRICNEPITSFGVILLKFFNNNNSNTCTTSENFMKTLTSETNEYGYINIDAVGIKSENSNDIETFCKYKNSIKFLLIRRRHTLGYIEFIRGRYLIDNIDGIMFLFQQMTNEEIKRIGTNTFDYLWNELWASNKNKTHHQVEYINSKQKFDGLINGPKYCCLEYFVKNIHPVWKHAEWGFPKGRRNNQEADIECALREFQEESGYDPDEYVVLDKLKPLEEKFYGTNGIAYRHVYFPAITTSDKVPKIDLENEEQVNEIGDIGWFNYDDAINLIRPHHLDRKKLLTELYMYTINTIINL